MPWSPIPASPYHAKINISKAFQAFNTSLPKNDPVNDFWLLKRRFQYAKDKPGADSWQTPEITEKIWSGDCEDAAVWLASRQACFGNTDCSDYPFIVVGTVSRGKGPMGWHVWCEWNNWVLDATMRKAPVTIEQAYKTCNPKFRYSLGPGGVLQEIYKTSN